MGTKGKTNRFREKKKYEEECPYNSVTIYHPVDQETARVEVGDEHTVELPNGDYEITRQHNSRCVLFTSWLDLRNFI
ncbi:hypothetical protein EB796_001033 [Bugula neritina]|uniref:Uncharacterized protein n=1 Tax=Bugula neritina TaxID=10212 RepID=A0A7J7KR00_BUGNE|nr:hypothetical protein EB796_001033 [Bugula neritina]